MRKGLRTSKHFVFFANDTPQRKSDECHDGVDGGFRKHNGPPSRRRELRIHDLSGKRIEVRTTSGNTILHLQCHENDRSEEMVVG